MLRELARKGQFMKVPIRMIGVATTIFWIFIIAFSISAVYSIKDLQFDFGEPQTTMVSKTELVFSLPISIFNRGRYNMHDFNMTSVVMDRQNRTITKGSTFVQTIGSGQQVNTAHNVTINIADFLRDNTDLLFNDTELMLNENVGMTLAELIPVRASGNIPMPWGAPLYNFALGDLQYEPHNSTHFRARIPISFENHAQFDFAATIRVRMYSNVSSLISEGEVLVEVSPNSSYNGFLELYIPVSAVSPNGRFEASFIMPFLEYGPLVIPYG